MAKLEKGLKKDNKDVKEFELWGKTKFTILSVNRRSYHFSALMFTTDCSIRECRYIFKQLSSIIWNIYHSLYAFCYADTFDEAPTQQDLTAVNLV